MQGGLAWAGRRDLNIQVQKPVSEAPSSVFGFCVASPASAEAEIGTHVRTRCLAGRVLLYWRSVPRF